MEWKPICCVIGAFLINLTLGTFYSYSNLFPYVMSYMKAHGNPGITVESGAWLTAAFLLGQGLAGILASYIEQTFNSRSAVILGCMIHCTSTYLTITALSMNLSAVIIIYGFGSGFGSGAAYFASIIAAQKWFPGHKGLFTGVIVAGFGLGGLIFTNLQTLYLNPNNLLYDKATGTYPAVVYDKVPDLFLYMGILFTVTQMIGCALAFSPPYDSSPSSTTTVQSPQAGPKSPSGHYGTGTGNVTMDEGLPEIRCIWSPFKHKAFYIVGLMMIMIAPGVTFVNSLGKPFGQYGINDDRFPTTVVALGALANAGGRLFWGFLMDRLYFSTCFTIKCAIFATLIFLFPFDFILTSKALYMMWMFGLFFSFSGGFVLMPVYLEQVFGSKYGGFVYSILFIAFALSSILTSFLLQVSCRSDNCIQKFLNRFLPCLLISISYCLSVLLYHTVLPTRRMENAIRRRKEQESMNGQRSLMNRADLFPVDRGTLAEKTAAMRMAAAMAGNLSKNDDSDSVLRRENSLGSIVKYNTNKTSDNNRIKTFN